MENVQYNVSLYTYEELDVYARDRAAEELIDRAFIDDYSMLSEEALVDDYGFNRQSIGEGGIELQYDFDHSQGSGLNITGYIDPWELVNACMGSAERLGLDTVSGTTAEAALEFIKEADAVDFEAPRNIRYTYNKWDLNYVAEDLYSHIIGAAYDKDLLDDANPDDPYIENYVFGPAAGDRLAGKQFSGTEHEAGLWGVFRLTCETMTAIGAELYELGDKLLETYYEPEAHEGNLYFANGRLWGDREYLEHEVGKDVSQQSIADTIVAAQESATIALGRETQSIGHTEPIER